MSHASALQKLSLTSSHGGSPLLINTKERNGSASLACTSPEEPDESDARVRGTLENGEEDGEVRCVGSTSFSSYFGDCRDDHTTMASAFPLMLCFMAQAVNPSFPNPRRRLRLRDLAERVIDASQNEQELNKLLNEALLERESVQA